VKNTQAINTDKNTINLKGFFSGEQIRRLNKVNIWYRLSLLRQQFSKPKILSLYRNILSLSFCRM
jgi:hypothetical protein